MASGTGKRILVADVEDARQVVSDCLAGYRLTFVTSLSEARVALRNYHDLIVVGLTFDDSHMFSLVSDVRSRGLHQRTPIIGIRHKPTALTVGTLRGVEDAMHVVGGTSFLDLSWDSEGCNRLRTEVERALRWGIESQPQA